MASICRTSPSSTNFVLFLLLAILVSITTTEALKPKVARLQFYMHDIVNGPNQTAVRVAPTEPVNFTNPDPIAATFGSISVMDNPLTATPDPKSALIGRAQGIYAVSSQRDELSLLMTLTYVLVSGPHNGSTFSVVGRNPVMSDVREMPIVGGTGTFRLARGYCLAQTHSMDGMDAFGWHHLSPSPVNATNPDPVAASFGSVDAIDNPLAATPDLNSAIIGRAQGRRSNSVREMPVLGGTGVFRLARGYSLAQTSSLNGLDAVVGYNVTLILY
ncbi:hypothetical protein IFM89_011459 [Coptis chinensis]|uniref:Dirigent protein n=1 Tax=Coptis chinensis TaxID=261450 RepID=A0A835IUP9_9MAGN|nr:hypothetical protein IFM89_011459 [Coptis chinensis]